ncbi:putative multidrug resistance protein [Platanthera guangdongensis]|uniref:Multidrug resistance protein n=1 Tax=Platanthera guangdongensis TaxID=2320717 RepID=A0ABR2MMG8_9ASPA
MFSAIGSVFAYAQTADYWLMSLGFIGAVGDGFLMPLLLTIMGKTVNSIGNGPSSPGFMHAINENSLRLVYLAIGSLVVSFFEGYCWTRTGERQAASMRGRYLKAVLRQDVGFFDLKFASTNEVITSVSSDSLVIQDVLSEKVIKAAFGAEFHYEFLDLLWELYSRLHTAVEAGGGGAADGGAAAHTGSVLRQGLVGIGSKIQIEYDKAGVVAEQAFSSIRTVYAFTAERRTMDGFSAALENSVRLGLEQGFAKGLAFGSNGITFSIWAFMLWYSSRLVMYHGAEGGTVFAVGGCIIMGGLAFGASLSNVKYFGEAMAAAERIAKVIERRPPIDSESGEGEEMGRVEGTVEFRQVRFAYPARQETEVLKGFNLRVEAGKTVALVGRSGSGKSTAIALLQRFYDPAGGEIELDGVDIRRLRLKWLRAQMGLVSQEPALFATTIKENILFGNEVATAEEVVAAAITANAHGFISQLPLGYDTQVGERGFRCPAAKSSVLRSRARSSDRRRFSSSTKPPTRWTSSRSTSFRMLSTPPPSAAPPSSSPTASPPSATPTASPSSKPDRSPSSAPTTSFSATPAGTTQPSSAPSNPSRLHSTISTPPPAPRPAEPQHEPPALGVELRAVGRGRASRCGSREAPGAVAAPPADDERAGVAAGRRGLRFGGLVRRGPAGVLLRSGQRDNCFLHQGSRGVEGEDQGLRVDICGVDHLLCRGQRAAALQPGSYGEYLTRRVRERMMSKMLTFEIGWFDQEENSTGAICSRLAKDATLVCNIACYSPFSAIAGGGSDVASNSGVIGGNGGLRDGFSDRVATGRGHDRHPADHHPLFLRPTRPPHHHVQKAINAQSDSSKLAAEAVGNLRTVTAFSSQDRILRLFHLAQSGPRRQSIKLSWVAGAGLGCSKFLNTCIWALGFWYGGVLVHQRHITSKALLETFMIIASTGRVIADAGSMTTDLAKGAESVASVFSILDRITTVDPDDPDGHRAETISGAVELRGVDFAYPSRPDSPVLCNFSLSIESGRSTALVGSSGSGKSTVISLIERFYDPLRGVVRIDGRDIRSYNLRSLRRHVALVGQEPTLIAGTLRDNITYGVDEASDAEVEAAATAANAGEFIGGLKDGYGTWCGERGVQLSGGQKQRVAIARAILRNPAILLLDEATSALDGQSEKVVQAALERVMVGRTSVVVAHRLNTIRNCDVIAVLHNGVLVEKGSHGSLMLVGPSGAYYGLVSLQQGRQPKAH